MPSRSDAESVEEPVPFESNASPIVPSWTDGRNPSGIVPSPSGVTRLVTVSTPGVASSAATVSRSFASDAGARMSPVGPASMSPLDCVILPLPRWAATMS